MQPSQQTWLSSILVGQVIATVGRLLSVDETLSLCYPFSLCGPLHCGKRSVAGSCCSPFAHVRPRQCLLRSQRLLHPHRPLRRLLRRPRSYHPLILIKGRILKSSGCREFWKKPAMTLAHRMESWDQEREGNSADSSKIRISRKLDESMRRRKPRYDVYHQYCQIILKARPLKSWFQELGLFRTSKPLLQEIIWYTNVQSRRDTRAAAREFRAHSR